jgi:hypothetical protein
MSHAPAEHTRARASAVHADGAFARQVDAAATARNLMQSLSAADDPPAPQGQVTAEVSIAGLTLHAAALDGSDSPIRRFNVDAPGVRAQLSALRFATTVVRASFDRHGRADADTMARGVDELMSVCLGAGERIAQALDARNAQAGWLLGPSTNFAVDVLADHWSRHGLEGIDARVDVMCAFARSRSFYDLAARVGEAPMSYAEAIDSQAEEVVRMRMSIAQGSLWLMDELEGFSYLNPPENMLSALVSKIVSKTEEIAQARLSKVDVPPELALSWKQATFLRLARLTADHYRREATADRDKMLALRDAERIDELKKLIAAWRTPDAPARLAARFAEEASEVYALVDDYASAALNFERRVQDREELGDAPSTSS